MSFYSSHVFINTNLGTYEWGRNTDGQLGIGAISNGNPVPTKTMFNVKFTSFGLGEGHTLGIAENGDLYAWGRNNYGQLGDGTNVDKARPTKIGNLKWKSVVGGQNTSLGITVDGDLYTWGRNNYGQLGIGNTTDKNTPTKVESLKWESVSIGLAHSAGITVDGDLYTWGQGSVGVLGTGNTNNQSSPVKITSLKWKILSCGEQVSFAITTDGDMYGWGTNTNYRLGVSNISTSGSSNVPIKIGNLKWKDVSCSTHAIALTTDGDLYAWGQNNQSAVGNGLTSDVSEPTKIGTLKFEKIRVGFNTSFAISTNNDLYTWGYNPYGQLGDGTTTNVLTPKLIMNLIEYYDKILLSSDNKTYSLQSEEFKLTEIPSTSLNNFINYGAPSIENFNLIQNSKNYILQDTVSKDTDGLWVQDIDRKPLSIKFE